ncbi:hypothetical protein F4777DRAFT_5236 [Nemania sp. FL0916]|nr:hypothetical protein F4777DRAFT_5236 [Nemania sp. FL0916]
MMEKYSQFRDRGSGISPFLPIGTQGSPVAKMLGMWLFLLRLPLVLAYCAAYFLVLDHLPLPPLVRKLQLWTMLGIPGIWWVDLQLDGVKRGSLYQQPPSRFPRERAVVAAQFTSPIDAVYLAAIFDPIFVVSFPDTRKVQRVSLFGAVVHALAPPVSSTAVPRTGLTTIRALLEQNPRRIIAAFPEMTTTNGKGILPLSSSLLACPADVNIFPVSLRYTPADVTTPVPGAWASFLWHLLSKPTHYIRVRVAEGVTTLALANGASEDELESTEHRERSDDDVPTPEEQHILDYIGETLARLARNKRVGLTLRDKEAFIKVWNGTKK